MALQRPPPSRAPASRDDGRSGWEISAAWLGVLVVGAPIPVDSSGGWADRGCGGGQRLVSDGPACRLIPRFLRQRRDPQGRAQPGDPVPLPRPGRDQIIGDEAVSLGASPTAGPLTAPAWGCSVGRPPLRVGARPPDRGRSAKRLAQQSMSSVLGYTTGNDADSARWALGSRRASARDPGRPQAGEQARSARDLAWATPSRVEPHAGMKVQPDEMTCFRKQASAIRAPVPTRKATGSGRSRLWACTGSGAVARRSSRGSAPIAVLRLLPSEIRSPNQGAPGEVLHGR
jgi:hypothetical protein